VRRRFQVLGWTLIWAGLFVFAYLGWELFGTDLVNAGVQEEAYGSLEDEIVTASTLPVQEVGSGSPGQTVLFHPEVLPEHGDAFAFIRIPRIDLDQVLFEGVDRQTLKSGPGHMDTTALPGQPGNAVISGHRTTYGRPFFDLDLLEVGDRIEVQTAVGTHVYAVSEVLIVEPSDVWVTDDRPGGWLTLTTCNPKFSARQRLVVVAEMVSGPNLEYIQVAG
jgi:sortase A